MDDATISKGESIYAMGNPYPLKPSECLLAKRIIIKIYPHQAGYDAHDDVWHDDNEDTEIDYPDEITGEIMEADDDLINKLCRPIAVNYKQSRPDYGSGGLLSGLKEYLDFDITLFAEEKYHAEICKIIYFFNQMQYQSIPKLISEKAKKSKDGEENETKVFQILNYFRKPSLEKADYSFYKDNTKNGYITRLMKSTLKKEILPQTIANIEIALDQVETTWNELLHSVRVAIDMGNQYDFDDKFRVLESILGKPHKWIATYDELFQYTSNVTTSHRELDAEEESNILRSIRYKAHGAEEAIDKNHCYIFKKIYIDREKELNFDQGIYELESICNGPHKTVFYTRDEDYCYSFKSTGKGKVREIQVWDSLVSEVHMEMSPIETLYLKISQFERLGELHDKMWLRDIEIISDYRVPEEFEKTMKQYKEERIEIKDVVTYIKNHAPDLERCIYLNTGATSENRQKLKDSAWKVPIVLKCCIHTRRLIKTEDEITVLLIISCLQAILIDEPNDDEYEFYNYQNFNSHKPKIRITKKDETKLEMVNAIKLCWARKTELHWYANQGKHKQGCQLKEFENKCDDVLTGIYSCSNISKMLSMNQDCYDKLTQTVFTA